MLGDYNSLSFAFSQSICEWKSPVHFLNSSVNEMINPHPMSLKTHGMRQKKRFVSIFAVLGTHHGLSKNKHVIDYLELHARFKLSMVDQLMTSLGCKIVACLLWICPGMFYMRARCTCIKKDHVHADSACAVWWVTAHSKCISNFFSLSYSCPFIHPMVLELKSISAITL